MAKQTPHSILSGVRASSAVAGVEISGEPIYIEEVGKWAFKIIIDLGAVLECAATFPRRTEWFVVVDPSYPLGQMEVYPSKKDGLTVTYEHQILNQAGPENIPWRTGKICHDSSTQRLGFAAGGRDPIGESEDRLKWCISQAVLWLRAAASGKLVNNGEPFELPWIATHNHLHIVHDESPTSFVFWEGVGPGEWGEIILTSIANVDRTSAVVAFFRGDGSIVRVVDKFFHILAVAPRKNGFWWLWPSPIVLEPWQAPVTWAELRSVGASCCVDVDLVLSAMAKIVRGGGPSILLIGYPMPDRIGSDSTEVHWQALKFPDLNKGNNVPGFRPNENGWWQRDRASVFSGAERLYYLSTQNWHEDRMQARGRFHHVLRKSGIVLIGCGALGSAIAEILVRGGVSKILLMDRDKIAAGNLVRHTLDGRDIGKNKAISLCDRLSTVAPFATVRALDDHLPSKKQELEDLLGEYELIIDCTGMDDVAIALGLGWWSISKLFVSLSVGYEARRAFVYANRGHSFPYKTFFKMADPFLREERKTWAEKGETLEGTGCWSPLFPARFDDILLMAASCSKVVEELIEEGTVDSRLIIFEQSVETGYSGLRRYEVQHGVEE